MRVINICREDYANYGYELAESMKLVGIDAEAFVTMRHAFGYAKQATHTNVVHIMNECEKADVIMVMHTDDVMYNVVIPYVGKKPIIIWHTGTRYRQNPDKYNKLWNPIATKVVCCLGEFMDMGCKKPEYFNMTINTDAFEPSYKTQTPLMFAHYPSNPIVKGTAEVKRILSEVRNGNRGRIMCSIDTSIIRHDRSLIRMRQCDVYVEMMATEQNGKRYGSFGTTALEAAAIGKIVVTNDTDAHIYKKYYGDCALHICNTVDEMRMKLHELANKTVPEIVELKKQSRLWVEKNHSRKSSGMRMIKLLKSIKSVRPLLSSACSQYL